MATAPQPDSRKAFHELLDLMKELDDVYLSEDWLVSSAEDVAEGTRALLHMLEGGLITYLEDDADHPVFRKIVDPARKYTGDNPYAIYHDAPVRSERSYRVRGNMAGACYMSLTIEADAQDGRMGSSTAGVINDTELEIGSDGSFEIIAGGPERTGNWLALPASAARITVRHYFEEDRMTAADPTKVVPLAIEMLDDVPPPATYGDASVAASIRRITNFMRTRTLDMKPPAERIQPDFVSRTPNEFPPPVKPGNFALAAADAAYSMAPYLLGPDEALVITGRWPECRCANVCLWNRHMQTFDYVNRPVALNRAQTTLESDGSFRMVIAHGDPGVPNWIDTEGRAFGLVFWRFMLPEGSIETPQAKVVKLDEVATS